MQLQALCNAAISSANELGVLIVFAVLRSTVQAATFCFTPAVFFQLSGVVPMESTVPDSKLILGAAQEPIFACLLPFAPAVFFQLSGVMPMESAFWMLSCCTCVQPVIASTSAVLHSSSRVRLLKV
jgi:hypothetical protein